jgi:hypothetical protein
MTQIDDAMLMAYVDAELDEVNRARVERAAADDPALTAAIAAQRRVRARLAGHYAPVLDEPVPERLRALLQPNVVAFGAKPRVPSRLGWRELGALAATFVAGLVGAELVRAPSQTAVGSAPLYASAGLARALDTQLASAQPEDAAVRVGVSFAARDGRLCRTFDTAPLAGLACHTRDQWEVVTAVRTSASAGGGEYRQAGTADAAVMQVAQDMMAGTAFDAAAERRARDAGWRNGR